MVRNVHKKRKRKNRNFLRNLTLPLDFETSVFPSIVSTFRDYFQILIHARAYTHTKNVRDCTTKPYKRYELTHRAYVRACTFLYARMSQVAFDSTGCEAGGNVCVSIRTFLHVVCRKSKVHGLQLVANAVIFRMRGPLVHRPVA